MNKNKVVIAGAGVMGASLAQVYSLAGYETWVYDVIEAGLEKGKHLVALNQEILIREGLVSAEESAAACSRITFTLEKECFRDCCLVVECVVERMEVKHSFWKEISEMVPEEALLATNTSGLSITEIAKACKNPERFMGQHWLNPPPPDPCVRDHCRRKDGAGASGYHARPHQEHGQAADFRKGYSRLCYQPSAVCSAA